MRRAAVLICLFLGGCAGGYELPVANPPDAARAIAVAKVVVKDLKLTGAVEISAVREAHPLSPGPYFLCIRGSVSEESPRRTFAVFFKNDEYISTRTSVIIDNCEAQAFNTLT